MIEPERTLGSTRGSNSDEEPDASSSQTTSSSEPHGRASFRRHVVRVAMAAMAVAFVVPAVLAQRGPASTVIVRRLGRPAPFQGDPPYPTLAECVRTPTPPGHGTTASDAPPPPDAAYEACQSANARALSTYRSSIPASSWTRNAEAEGAEIRTDLVAARQIRIDPRQPFELEGYDWGFGCETAVRSTGRQIAFSTIYPGDHQEHQVVCEGARFGAPRSAVWCGNDAMIRFGLCAEGETQKIVPITCRTARHDPPLENLASQFSNVRGQLILGADGRFLTISIDLPNNGPSFHVTELRRTRRVCTL